jgi:hypothetical protein
MPWEGLWHGVAQWLGVAEAQMDAVIPNRANFDLGTELLTEAQLFES